MSDSMIKAEKQFERDMSEYETLSAILVTGPFYRVRCVSCGYIQEFREKDQSEKWVCHNHGGGFYQAEKVGAKRWT